MINCDNPVDSPIVLAVRRVLGNFGSHRQQIVGGDSRAWSWAEGVILFPEALCPNCNGVMKSTRIWHVDERGQKVIAVAYLEDGKVQKVLRAVHPHVDGSSGGYICLGDAKSATEALFLGLGMGSPYWSPRASWYEEVFNHHCSSDSQRKSRAHLTASMALGEEKAEAPAVPVVEVTAATVEQRQAARLTRERRAILRRQRRIQEVTEQPLFNGSMIGNTESTGISADEQPTGLRLDRL